MANRQDIDAWLVQMKGLRTDRVVLANGVVFRSEEQARIYSDQCDKDLVCVEGSELWLAKNRQTTPGPMPTKEGDVVVHHLHQLFLVWVVTSDGAQEPVKNVGPLERWQRSEAAEAAQKWASETGGRIFLLQTDGDWVVREAVVK